MYVRIKLEILKIVNLDFELSSSPFEKKKEEKTNDESSKEDIADTKSS
jgi:hypothetical protein